MKKVVALMILLATWYFAGMNGIGPMMAAILCGIIFIVISLILSRVLKQKTDVFVPPQDTIMYKNVEIPFRFDVSNQGRLPVNRFALSFLMKYRSDKRAVRKKLFGSAGADTGKEYDRAEFYFTPPYCGLIEIIPKKIRVYDYLLLISSSKKLRNKAGEVLILPFPKKMRIAMPNMGAYTADPTADSSSDKSGEDHNEIRLIHEYREGDLMRHIHRNYSTRTEKLWVKEYQKENDYIFDLVLDTSSESPMNTEDLDAFYEITAAVAASLAESDVSLRTYWYDQSSGGLKMRIVDKKEDVSELMKELIHSDTTVTPEVFSSAAGALGKSGMIINSKLEWYFLEQPVFHFSKENTEKEITGEFFDLRR